MRVDRVPAACARLVLAVLLVAAASPGNASSPKDNSIDDVLDGLRLLPFDDFVDESYTQILLRSPESVTELGLSEDLGIRDDRLDNVCYDFVDDTYRLEEGILDLLRRFTRNSLGYEQQISLDSYSWLLQAWVDEHEFMYHFYPVTYGLSRQNTVMRFFRDVHPMESRDNADDYIDRLDQVDDQLGCLVQNMHDSEQRGIIAPAAMLQWAADRIRGIVPGTARDLPFYTAFSDRLNGIPGLTPAERQALLEQARQAIDRSVIPAYQGLVIALDRQALLAPPMNGVWQLPNGDRFFASRLRYHTTTDLTPDEIHQLGLAEVDRIRTEIEDAFDSLGYPNHLSLAERYELAGQDSGIIPADQIVSHNEAIIRQAQDDIAEVFDIAPESEVIVVGGTGSFYVPGSIDGERPGTYYINNQHDEYRYWMRTIAYHEAVPGHHFQISIGNERDLPLFTKAGVIFNGFVEGWALYAERLAMEMGWYDDDVYSELGRLQWELLRAARMVVETGLHDRRWTRQQAIDYYMNTVGADEGLATGQIDLYLYYVGTFSAYKLGELKLLELRQHARDELGDLFDIKDFHRVVLLHHRMPLEVLERVVQDYIDRASNPPPAPRQPGGRRTNSP